MRNINIPNKLLFKLAMMPKDNLINLTLPEALDFVKQSYPTTYQQILPLLIERNLIKV